MNRDLAAALDVGRPERALLDLIEADRQRRRTQTVGEARARAAELRGQASADARRRVRAAFEEQRRRQHEAIAAARARLATQRRLHEQQHTAALLLLAWQQLPEELAALWRDPGARAAWAARAMADAQAHLPAAAGSPWRIVHAPDWPAAEREALATASDGHGAALRFEADPSVRAGLKIVAGGNVVDGTLDGLLADRADIESRLLHGLEKR